MSFDDLVRREDQTPLPTAGGLGAAQKFSGEQLSSTPTRTLRDRIEQLEAQAAMAEKRHIELEHQLAAFLTQLRDRVERLEHGIG